MGGGASTDGMASGAIAAARDTSMSPPVFDSVSGSVSVPSVLAPSDGWVVVRSTEASGGVLGAAPVRAGLNRDVDVRLDAVGGRLVLVALHVDRGVRGDLEFDPAQSASALDKPVLVAGAAVAYPLSLDGWGVDALPNTALIMVDDQPAGASLEVGYLLVPGPTWIEVRLLEKGVPTRRLGLLQRPAGESQLVEIPLSGAKSGDALLVTVIADRGVVGRFEPGAGNPLLAADQPWVSAGIVVSRRIRVR
jgi:hypothetical protein